MRKYSTNLCVLILFPYLTCVLPETDILVTLPNGILRGKRSTTHKNNEFYKFLKVPYASPPIGELRFKAPVPPQNWDGIRDATENRVICYQVNRDMPIESEDCLYLNIYTPQLPNAEKSVSLPVIFYIHGGGFIQGTCLDSVCGPEFLLDYSVVVVTINYRLGPFGFLSTQDDVIPGNNGLKDQHMGIKWTHDNIALFGGDPNRITIVGQSAGAASVAYQLLNKNSEGLFWGAICQSGSFLSPWSLQRNAREIAFKTANFINDTFNDKTDTKELKEFLLSVSADDLDKASTQVHLLENLKNRQINQGFFYAPVLEVDNKEAFITRKMYKDLKNGNFVKVPIIIGINSEESVEDAADLETLRDNMKTYDENLEWLIPDDLNIDDNENRQLVGKLIRDLYTNSNFENDLVAGIRYFSDTAFTRSVIKHAELQSKFTDVYFYQFSYDGLIGNISVNYNGLEKVAHTEDLRYTWGTNFEGYDNTNIDQLPPEDVTTHYRLLTMWTNFAKTLNPTPEKIDLLQNIEWPTVGSGRPRDFFYLNIDTDLTIGSYPKIGSYLGWNMIYDIFGDGEFDTY